MIIMNSNDILGRILVYIVMLPYIMTSSASWVTTNMKVFALLPPFNL